LLCDFGLARTVFNDSVVDPRDRQCEGTAPYMSPAVAAGEAEDTRCDIYSLGAMLYEMVTGSPPYTGLTLQAILDRILAGPPTPVRALNPDAPPGLVRVIEGAMARDLRDRYAQMSDVVAELDRLAEGKDTVGPHGKKGIGVPLRASRVGIALTVAAVVIACAAFLLKNRPAAERPPMDSSIRKLPEPKRPESENAGGAPTPGDQEGLIQLLADSVVYNADEGRGVKVKDANGKYDATWEGEPGWSSLAYRGTSCLGPFGPANYVSMPTTLLSGKTKGVISLWVYLESLSSRYAGVLMSWDEGGGVYGYIATPPSSDPRKGSITLNLKGDFLKTGTDVVVLKKWHQIQVRWSRKSRAIYVDGLLKAETKASGGFPRIHRLVLGKYVGLRGFHLDGRIDDVIVATE